MRKRNGEGKPRRTPAEPEAQAAESDSEAGPQNHRQCSGACIEQSPGHFEGPLVNGHAAHKGEDGDEEFRLEQTKQDDARKHHGQHRHHGEKELRKRGYVFIDALRLVNAEIREPHPLRAKSVSDHRPGKNQHIVAVLRRAGETRENSNCQQVSGRGNRACAHIENACCIKHYA